MTNRRKGMPQDPPRLVKARPQAPQPPMPEGTLQTALRRALSPSLASPAATMASPTRVMEAQPVSLARQVQDRAASPSPTLRSNTGTETRRTATGVIAHVVVDRGFAFVRDDAADGKWQGMEYFLHRAMIGGEAFNQLEQGMRVQFDAVFSPKGWRAVRVTRIPAQEVSCG